LGVIGRSENPETLLPETETLSEQIWRYVERTQGQEASQSQVRGQLDWQAVIYVLKIKAKTYTKIYTFFMR
jgi:hypothetical protein